MLAKGIMIFMGAGAALLILLGGFALAFAALTAAAAPLGIALGPLLLIVAAIPAVAAAAYLIYDNWGAISGWFGNVWNDLCAIVSFAFALLKTIFYDFTPLAILVDAFVPAMGYLQNLDFAGFGRNLIDGLIRGFTSRLAALKSTIINAASSVANWFRQTLGIHSPSRVFAGLGGFVMAGLDQGLAANTSGPLSRINDLSGQMTRALSVGAIGTAMATASPAAAQSPTGTGAGSAPVQHFTYNVTIIANGGDPQDLESRFREFLERMERERRGRGFGDN